MLGERDRGRNLDSSKQTLNEFLDRWLELCAKPRLRAKSFRDYEGLLHRYVRPALGAKALANVFASTSRRSTANCWTDTCRLVRFDIRTLSSGRRSSRPFVGISSWGIPQMPSISQSFGQSEVSRHQPSSSLVNIGVQNWRTCRAASSSLPASREQINRRFLVEIGEGQIADRSSEASPRMAAL
jgi:hypothetical protein